MAVLVKGLICYNKQMIRHILIFKFNEGVPQEERDLGIDMLKDLKNKIPEIKEWEIRKQREPSKKFSDFIQISSFEDVEAIDRFKQSQDHEEVKQYLKARATWVKVDYDF